MESKPLAPGRRVLLGVTAAVMLAIGLVYAATHATEGIRRAGWMGQAGRLVVAECDPHRGSRGGTTYQCYGEFTADNGVAVPGLSRLDDTSSSPYRIGKVLKATSDGHGTVSPVGAGYALDAWAEFLFVGVAVGGIGVFLGGAVLARPEGRLLRISTAVCRAGLAMIFGGGVSALILAVAGLF
ncbi:hypothetical protein [Catenulispora subtropica]|uniref:hypothetical protein n=1 Tax=Catenulispora subtropica TaxID=450798 RepID=UPI0031D84B62